MFEYRNSLDPIKDSIKEELMKVVQEIRDLDADIQNALQKRAQLKDQKVAMEQMLEKVFSPDSGSPRGISKQVIEFSKSPSPKEIDPLHKKIESFIVEQGVLCHVKNIREYLESTGVTRDASQCLRDMKSEGLIKSVKFNNSKRLVFHGPAEWFTEDGVGDPKKLPSTDGYKTLKPSTMEIL